MSQPNTGGPFRVVYSKLGREGTRQLLARAQAVGRFAELAGVVRAVRTRLEWIPLDFGEPLQNLANLGIQEHIGVIAPVVVTYGVDEVRRIVYVAVPFRLLPNSGV